MKYAFFSALFAALISFAAMAETAKAATSAALFVEKMGKTALTSLTAADIAASEREERVRKLLHANFDLSTIGRFAMGPYWKTATDAQKKEYMTLFEDMIVKTYARRFEEYSGQSFQVTGSEEAGERDSIVKSQIIVKDGPPLNVDWRVRNKDGAYKIVDVVVESVSMSVTQRSDFAAVIQGGGGQIEALLSSLRQRKDRAAQKL